MPTPDVKVDAVMAQLQEGVRARLRGDLVQHGASPALGDPGIFAEVERVLRDATEHTAPRSLLLPELMGDPSLWRIEPALRIGSHRGALAAGLIRGVKQRVILPAMRWLFEYSHDNFARQQRVNQVLFACVQELAIQNAELRRDVARGTHPGSDGPPEAR
ncbi:MAG: hypothetical protein M3R55_00195 [Acidobacteriota bacterium]|nr:hypothetical protein [Acidobacteriota bacterium]